MFAFAKLIFTLAATLGPGNDLSWPQMQAAALGPGIEERTVVEDVWTPPTVCSSADPGCVPFPGGFTAGKTTRYLCVQEPGVYQVTARIGLMPLPAGAPDVHGQVWLRGGPDGGVLLSRLFAAAGHWSVQGATHVLVATAGSCYSLAYDMTGPAVVNPDTRATYLTIHRVGQP